MSLVIKNVKRIIKANNLEKIDVRIENGKFTEFAKDISIRKNDTAIDGKGCLITAGLLDIHTHLREPGFTHKETIETGCFAAARGGFTQIYAMPNTKPAMDSVESVEAFYQTVKEKGIINAYTYACITKGLISDEAVDQKALLSAGATAFSNDGLGVQSAQVMYEAMVEAKKNNAVIVAHAEDDSLKLNGVCHDNAAARLGLPLLPAISEAAQVARDIVLAEKSGVHYHVCHVSCKETVDAIRDGKRRGINVTAEVTPHHLILTEDDILNDDANFKMNPPLRSKEDREALIEALVDGTIDCIASDHAPHSDDEKARGFLKAPFGILGLEFNFALVYTEFVKKGIFSLEDLVNYYSVNAAKCIEVEYPKLELGAVADCALFDLENKITIQKPFASMSNNSPFIGKEVYGDCICTIVNGKVVYS